MYEGIYAASMMEQQRTAELNRACELRRRAEERMEGTTETGERGRVRAALTLAMRPRRRRSLQKPEVVLW
ncbi:hypothetical protein DY023_15975 [Microbacterium bovistercoris]|uniref:Uncharacterized protein n=1 Tax=Microbacterium bovistercoris TaxID=2293570 RepID=A0A371NQG0_9MICO|nr:hypothetical protein [Microbacterium bovistercoris]REJ04391.1 hypothetical protein DY023_15975 [Microbacterium bovistercoris]